MRRVSIVAHPGAEERLIFEGALEFVLLLAEYVGGELEDAHSGTRND